MAFFTFNGTTYPVAVDAEEGEPVRIGGESRAQAGNLRLQYSDEKRTWSMTLGPMSQALETTLRADARLGAFRTATGDFLLGASITASLVIRSSRYIKDLITNTRMRQVSITVREK